MQNFSPDAEKIVATLKPRLQSELPKIAPNGTVLGAQLVPLINRLLDPGLTYRNLFPSNEKPSLQKLVERYLADCLEPTGQRHGSDFIYRVASVYVASSPSAGQVWKSFVAVNPSHRLGFNRRTGELLVVSQVEQLPSDLVEIAAVEFAEHRKLCQKFSDDHLAIPQLKSISDNYTKESYPQWLQLLRETPRLLDEWIDFRRNAFLQTLESRLQVAGASAAQIAQLLAGLKPAKTNGPQPVNHSPAAHPMVGSHPAHNEKWVREILHRAIDKLDCKQLREMQFPVGVILDAVNDLRNP